MIRKTRKQNELLVKLLISLALLTGGATSHAAIVTGSSILTGPTDAATGVRNLDIGGTFYNVTFNNYGSYNARVGTETPTFLDDQPGAVAARDAIRTVLNDNNVTGITNLTSNDPSSFQRFVMVPWALTDTGVTTHLTTSLGDGNWDTPNTANYSRTTNYGNVSWATFVVAVPEPSALLLAGLALVGLCTRRRRA